MAVDRLYMYSWYHGELARSASEAVLQSKKPGLFLVRDSTTLQGGYVLSVSENNKVSHYIITHKNGQYQIGDQTFNDLPDIVEFYKRHFLDTTTLVEAAPRQKVAEEEPQSELLKVRAKYNFPGNDLEDLPFKKNDILTVLKKEEELWWMARDCTGKEGMIPANYVDEIPNRSSYTSKSGTALRTSTHSSGTLPGDSVNPSRGYVAPTEVTVPAIAEAIQDRHPTVYDPSELKFAKGDRILVLSMPDKGSWEGQLQDGRKGIFPFRYVKIISSVPSEVSKFKSTIGS